MCCCFTRVQTHLRVVLIPVQILWSGLQVASLRIRPPQDVDVPADLYFQIPCFRPKTHHLYPRSAHQPRRPWTKTRTSASSLETVTRASKIQDGEDVDVLRRPAQNLILGWKPTKQSKTPVRNFKCKLETRFLIGRQHYY